MHTLEIALDIDMYVHKEGRMEGSEKETELADGKRSTDDTERNQWQCLILTSSLLSLALRLLVYFENLLAYVSPSAIPTNVAYIVRVIEL